MFRSGLVKAIAKAGVEEKLVEQLLEVPPHKQMGDFALPCFKLAAVMKKSPAAIAQELREKIPLPQGFSKAEAKGPYINFYLDEGKFSSLVIAEILREKGKYGLARPTGEKIIVEYCQANPMKAFHIGHVRNIVLGEAISRLFEASGRKVFRANYGGDVGPHVSKTLYAYRELSHMPEPKDVFEKGKWLGDLYASGAKAVREDEEQGGSKGLEQKMRDMVVALEKGRDKWLVADWKRLRKASLKYFDGIYTELGTEFDRIILESEVEKEGIKIAHRLLEQGFAIKDQGAVLVDLEEQGLGKFLILKSDGAALYSSKDLALAKLKKEKIKAGISYNVVGAEQTHYFRQLVKTLDILNESGPRPEYCKTVALHYELVRLESGKMSSREGNVITYYELYSEVFAKTLVETMQRHPSWKKGKLEATAKAIGLAAIKFGMLAHDRNSVITFNWEKATAIEGETGPFILYSYARANSILRKAGKLAKAKPGKIMLTHEKEKTLVSMLAAFRGKVGEAAEQSNPHKIAFYLLKLSQEFNSFYHEVPVLQAEKEKAVQRLALVKAVAQILENGLWLLNIEPITEM